MSAIVGLSGLGRSVRFRQEHWDGLEAREYRICQGLDSAAAIVIDGVKVAAAAEERFARNKQCEDFPACAISFCLEHAGLSISDIDEIAHSFDYSSYREIFSLDPLGQELYDSVLSKDALLEQLSPFFPDFPVERVNQVAHHLAHAASAYFTSGWDERLVLVIDGMGETRSISIYHAHDGELEKLREIFANDSVGILYSLVTFHLGFDFNSNEYKIMGWLRMAIHPPKMQSSGARLNCVRMELYASRFCASTRPAMNASSI
jgi:carbamoyltransferase